MISPPRIHRLSRCDRRVLRDGPELRWLKSAETFKPNSADKHQLIYLMEGKGNIRLNDRDYAVEKGAGIYLGPAETATIQAASGASLKLLHLVVPQIPK